ncbi:MAG: hypothetical protein ISS69_14750 [Phycisphaerae bacterium]|nr:hypothetical protein [Phycisphaerae bacterium]
MIRSRMLWMLAGAAVLAGPLIALNRSGPAKPIERITYLPGRELAKLANKGIDESSGLTAGRRNKGVLWTHNDSGDRPQFFAINFAGADLATVTLIGAGARDWEDICSFTINRKHFLMLGDFGDNGETRLDCRLYIVAEPLLNTARRGDKFKARCAMTIPFDYADGPRNCESVGVDSTTRTIYLVSKQSGGKCKVYTMGLPNRSPRKPLVAKAIATLSIPTTTAMDISPDGLRAVVLTYGHAYEYVRGRDETWAAGFSRKPRILRIPRRRQGESICYGPAGQSLYLTSEKLPTPLIQIPAKAPTTKPAPKK